jgi:hypothetical protein
MNRARRRGAPRGRGAPPVPPRPAPIINVTLNTTTVPVGPKIAFVVNATSLALDTTVPHALAAIMRQVNEQFAQPPPLGYGIGIQSFRLAEANAPPTAEEWVMTALDQPPDAGALGEHQLAGGNPSMWICPPLDQQDGVLWTTTASHELLETLKDPYLQLSAQGVDGKFYAYEVCDPVESDTYTIDGIAVSNFVLPPYFEPGAPAGTKLDWLGLVKTPLEVRPGGYNQYWDGSKWTEIQAQLAPPRAARRGRFAWSRRDRRRKRPTTS